MMTARDGRLVCSACNRTTEHEAGGVWPEWALCDACGAERDRRGVPYEHRRVFAHVRARELERGGIEMGSDTRYTRDGMFRVYHKGGAGYPEAHEGGPWFYEPVDWAEGEVYSPGYATAEEALEAAGEWEAEEEIREGLRIEAAELERKMID